MATSSFSKRFIANKSDKEKLRKLIKTSELEEICEMILENANETIGFQVWTSVLSRLEDEEKLFDIVKDVRSD